MKIRKLSTVFSILFSLTLLFGNCGIKMNDQSKTNKSPKTTNDTIFLLRELTDTPYAFYHAIFIDTTKAIRNTLTDFSLGVFDSSYIEAKALLSPFENFNKEINKTFPRRWISIHQYKNEYFLYSPCDFVSHFRYEIKDSSTLEDIYGESPVPGRINSIQSPSSTTLIIDRSLPWGRNNDQLQINIIDPKNGIAIFTIDPKRLAKEGFRFFNVEFQFLMVDANKAHLYRTIVNYCKEKTSEFTFDSIKYKSPLK